jgi:hypothetical protein
MVAVKSHGTELTIVMYLFYVLIYDEVDAKFSIKLRIKLRYRENMLVRSQLETSQTKSGSPSQDLMAVLIVDALFWVVEPCHYKAKSDTRNKVCGSNLLNPKRSDLLIVISDREPSTTCRHRRRLSLLRPRPRNKVRHD